MHFFEFDPMKSAANKLKHGIDFEEAADVWNDERLIEIPALTVDEQRFLAIGTIAGKHWAAVYTKRGDAIRLISARRARKSEVEIYESAEL